MTDWVSDEEWAAMQAEGVARRRADLARLAGRTPDPRLTDPDFGRFLHIAVNTHLDDVEAEIVDPPNGGSAP